MKILIILSMSVLLQSCCFDYMITSVGNCSAPKSTASVAIAESAPLAMTEVRPTLDQALVQQWDLTNYSGQIGPSNATNVDNSGISWTYETLNTHSIIPLIADTIGIALNVNSRYFYASAQTNAKMVTNDKKITRTFSSENTIVMLFTPQMVSLDTYEQVPLSYVMNGVRFYYGITNKQDKIYAYAETVGLIIDSRVEIEIPVTYQYDDDNNLFGVDSDLFVLTFKYDKNLGLTACANELCQEGTDIANNNGTSLTGEEEGQFVLGKSDTNEDMFGFLMGTQIYNMALTQEEMNTVICDYANKYAIQKILNTGVCHD